MIDSQNFTLKTSLSFRSPCHLLICYLPFAIDEESREMAIGIIRYTFISDDGNEFRARMATRECPYVIEHPFARNMTSNDKH